MACVGWCEAEAVGCEVGDHERDPRTMGARCALSCATCGRPGAGSLSATVDEGAQRPADRRRRGRDQGRRRHARGRAPEQPRSLQPTEASSAEDLLREMVAAVESARGPSTVGGGVGVPSVVEFATGRVRSSINLHLADLDLRRVLQERLGLPGLRRQRCHRGGARTRRSTMAAGRWSQNLVMFTVGTGIGGGLVLGGTGLPGRHRGRGGARTHADRGRLSTDGAPAARQLPAAPARSSRLPPGACWTASAVKVARENSLVGARQAGGVRRARSTATTRSRPRNAGDPRGDRHLCGCSASGSASGSRTRSTPSIRTWSRSGGRLGGGGPAARAAPETGSPVRAARRGRAHRDQARPAWRRRRGPGRRAAREARARRRGQQRSPPGPEAERGVSAESVPANPFAQDVEEPLPAPTTLVIFGATGDLAARKLLPAIYNLGARRAAAGEVRRDRDRARARRPRAVPPPRPRGDRRVLAHRHRRRHLEDARAEARLPERGLRRSGAVRGARGQDWEQGAATADAAGLLPGGFAQLLRHDREGARGGRAGRRGRPADPADDREAIRPRPRLGAGAERARSPRRSTSRRSFASTTTWARRRCRTSR